MRHIQYYLTILLFCSSFLSFSQEIKTYLKGEVKYLNYVSNIFHLENRPYYLRLDVEKGFLIWDILSEKNFLIKEVKLSGDLKDSRNIIYRYLGEINGEFYFFIKHNIDDSGEKKTGEMWSFNGKRLKLVKVSPALQELFDDRLYGDPFGPSIYRTNDLLYFRFQQVANSKFDNDADRLGDYTQFDGNSFNEIYLTEFLNSIGDYTFGQPGTRLEIYRNKLVFNVQNSFSSYKKYVYNQGEFHQIYMGEIPHSLIYTCDNHFFVTQENDLEELHLNTYNERNIFTFSSDQFFSNMVFTHGKKLIFGFSHSISEGELKNGDGLYISDGTKDGTRFLSRKPFENQNDSRHVSSYSTFNNLTYFLIEEIDRQNKKLYRIWATDGTTEGTRFLFQSRDKIYKVVNHKGKVIYARDVDNQRSKLYTLVKGKEQQLLDETKYPNQYMYRDDREYNRPNDLYDIMEDGKLYMIVDRPEAASILLIDFNPLAKSEPELCLFGD